MKSTFITIIFVIAILGIIFSSVYAVKNLAESQYKCKDGIVWRKTGDFWVRNGGECEND